jgi:hypothetical protein
MTAGVRVAAFAALLALIFTAAALAGRAIAPDTGAQHAPAGDHGHATARDHGHASARDHGHATARDHGHAPARDHATARDHSYAPAAPHAGTAPGLSLANDGLRLVPAGTITLRPHRAGRFAFAIVDAHAGTVRAFDTEQGRRMHLIVVRRDLTGYQHLHPIQAPDGTWTTPLRLPAAGVYRAFADFQTAGRRNTLGVDLLAAGTFAPRPLPPASTTAHTDGYEVLLHEHGTTAVSFGVRRGGTPVALQPYLGARGHLVILRAGDLAYQHVHPLHTATEPGQIAFASASLSPGRYRLFLQFRHAGRVHTATFTREVAP